MQNVTDLRLCSNVLELIFYFFYKTLLIKDNAPENNKAYLIDFLYNSTKH